MNAPGGGPVDATALRARILAGDLQPRDAVTDALARIAALDTELGAFVSVWRDEALARADELERRRAAGEPPGPLFGVPVALKSNLCFEGHEAHCGSRILEGWRAPYTATAVARLLDAGDAGGVVFVISVEVLPAPLRDLPERTGVFRWGWGGVVG